MGTPFSYRVQKSYPYLDFVYIAITKAYARKNDFGIIPLHPASSEMREEPEFLNYDEGINSIDWDTMNERNFTDRYGKMVCMAECVSTRKIIIKDLIENDQVKFFVKSIEDKKKLQEIYKKIFPYKDLNCIDIDRSGFFS